MSGAEIGIEKISKTYGQRQVLKEIDLTIAAGEFVSIIGASGVGKSTLLKILAGIEQPTGGRIEAVSRRQPPSIKIMFQEDRLLPWRTLRGNVELGLKGGRQAAAAMLGHVGLGGRDDDFPVTLSGGQRQRVALARALVHEPDLLLLDEPFGALDALTRATMHELLQTLLDERPRTVVLVTHDVEEAILLSDRIVVMRGGAIAHEVAIEAPRPRSRGDAALAALKDDLIRQLIDDEESYQASSAA